MHLSTTGVPAYGFATVSVDGAVPAALSGKTAGVPSGPSWLDANTIGYQINTAGSTWILQSYNVSTTATATLSSSGANTFYAGASFWAAWLSGSGVRTSLGGFLPFASSAAAQAAGLAAVSTAGEMVAITSFQSGTGLTVYSAAGAILYSNPSIALSALSGQPTRIHDGYLTWFDASGWHMRKVADGSTPTWCPRTDGVLSVIPVLVGSDLYVVETNQTSLTIRPAAKATGFVVQPLATGAYYWNTAQLQSAGVVRCGFCTGAAELTAESVLVDVTVATGANTRGNTTGTMTSQPVLTSATFPVGPAEGNSTAPGQLPPDGVAFTQPNGSLSIAGRSYLQNQSDRVTTVTTTVNATPKPAPPPPSFGTIQTTPTSVAATQANDTVTFTSADGTVTFGGNAAQKQLDFSAATSASRALMLAIASLRA